MILILGIIKLLKRKRAFKNRYQRWPSSEDIESIPNNDSWDNANGHLQGKHRISNSSNPIKLIHGDNQTSFFFTMQQFLHICLIIIPIVDIITKVTLKSSEKLQGVNVFYSSSSLLTWLIALLVLRFESCQFFKARRSSHSVGLLLFWSLSFITENLSFISWNNKHWWFHADNPKQDAELGLFVTRYVCVSLLFLLGFSGPGLYKPETVIEVNKRQGPDDATSVVSTSICIVFLFVRNVEAHLYPIVT